MSSEFNCQRVWCNSWRLALPAGHCHYSLIFRDTRHAAAEPESHIDNDSLRNSDTEEKQRATWKKNPVGLEADELTCTIHIGY